MSGATQRVAGEMTPLEMRCALNVCEVAIALGPHDTVEHWAPLLLAAARHVFFKKGGDALNAAWFSCLAAATWRSKTPLALSQLVAHLNGTNGHSTVSLLPTVSLPSPVSLMLACVCLFVHVCFYVRLI
jgi:hypothetical protein